MGEFKGIRAWILSISGEFEVFGDSYMEGLRGASL
jgi:hypothetical protein